MSVAKCLPISSGARARKENHPTDGRADGGEWEKSHPHHQTTGNRHSHGRIIAFWSQGGLLFFLGLVFQQIWAPSPPPQYHPLFFKLGFPGCSSALDKQSHSFHVLLQVTRKKEGFIGVRTWRKVSLPSFPWTHLPSHNKTVSPLSDLPSQKPFSN